MTTTTAEGTFRTIEKRAKRGRSAKKSAFSKNQPFYHRYNWTLGSVMDPVWAKGQRQLQLTPTGTKRQRNMRVRKCGQVLAICSKTVLKPEDKHGLLTRNLKMKTKQSYHHLKCTVLDEKVVPLPENITKASQQIHWNTISDCPPPPMKGKIPVTLCPL